VAAKDTKQVFDVSKPGKSAPSATSRPVIVGHGSMLRDPMMQDDTKDDKEEEDTPVTARSKIVIKPVDGNDSDDKSDKERPETQEKPEVSEKKIEPAEEKTAAQTDDKPEVKPEEKPEEAKSADDEAAVNALAEQAVKKKKEEVSQEEIAKQEAYEKLIEDKKYFLPIGKATKRRHTQHFLTFLFVILLLVPGAYLAVDAGIVETSFELPFDLIKN